jgi:isopropylmalate/homocitrate/citramalate synthase
VGRDRGRPDHPQPAQHGRVDDAEPVRRQIEWFITHQKHPKRAIISLHTHNDRGTGVAASELGLLAGATRVEGTLFGNGERTGNVDIVTLALNMFTQGVDPKLDFSNCREVRDLYERCTKLDVPCRSASPTAATWSSPPFRARTRTRSTRG